MANNFKKITFFVFVAVLATMPFAISASAAWQNPLGGTVPPDNNADAPINVGGTTQTKSGGLNISGNVSIGTINPGSKLSVTRDDTSAAGDYEVAKFIRDGSVDSGNMYIKLGTGGYQNTIIGQNDGGSGPFTYGRYLDSFIINNWTTSNFGSLILGTNNQARVVIKHDGNVGISSTTPNFLLSLDGSSGVNRIGIGSARIVGLSLVPINDNEAASKYYVENYVDSFVSSAWTVNGTNIYNSNSGNVGIGTAAPSSKLHVNGNGLFSDTLSISNLDDGKNLLYLYGSDSDKWIGFGGHGLHIGATSYAHNTIYLGPKGSTSGSLRSDVVFNWTDNSPTSYRRWVIRSREDEGSIIGYADDGSTARTMISSTGNSYFNIGNVGIGTTNPTAKLEVNGAIKQERGQRLNLSGRNRTWQIASYPKDATNSGTSEALIVNLYDSSSYSAPSYNTVIIGRTGEISLGFSGGNPQSSYPVSIRTYDDGTNINVYVVSSNYCDYYTVDVVYNRLNNILTESHVGDNTYTPAGSLVANSITAPCYMSAGGQVRSTLLANGNFGIGTNNPAEKLDVVGNGSFSGDLSVGGQINLGGADAAEEFVPDKDYPKGTVLVMAEGGFKNVTACSKEYDSSVVGVVSGQASVIMGKVAGEKKSVVAMVGVIPVKVNDSSGLIKKGDLLTTSGVTGEAMLATDPKIGTVIGKALEDAVPGHCEIQTLINLQ